MLKLVCIIRKLIAAMYLQNVLDEEATLYEKCIYRSQGKKKNVERIPSARSFFRTSWKAGSVPISSFEM